MASQNFSFGHRYMQILFDREQDLYKNKIKKRFFARVESYREYCTYSH